MLRRVGEPVIHPSVHLFCGDCDLWTSVLLQGKNAKVIIDTSEFDDGEPFIEKKVLFFIYIVVFLLFLLLLCCKMKQANISHNIKFFWYR